MATTMEMSLEKNKDTKKETDSAPLLSKDNEETEGNKCKNKHKWIAIISIIILLGVAAVLIYYFIFIEEDDELSEEGPGWSPTTDCDPISPIFCQLPWPNNYWLNQDSNYNPISLQLTDGLIPNPINGPSINVSRWNLLNGFSPLPVIMTYFDDLSLLNSPNIPYLWNFSVSDTISSPILLLEVSTGKLIPNWVELDYSSLTGDVFNESSPDLLPITSENNLTLLINPSYRLNDGQRYIVIIRWLRDNDNNLIEPSPAFKRLINNNYTATENENKRTRYYEDRIFNILQDNNITINDLQMSWDFTVMSTEYQTNAMLKMREDALNRIDNNGNNIQYIITDIIDDAEELQPYIARKVIGTMSVPWYLNQDGPGVDVRIVYENDNDILSDPVYQQHINVSFELLIPYSVINGLHIPNFCIFGHGLFQSYQTVEALSDSLDEIGLIGVAVSFIGMSDEDQLVIIQALTNDFTDLIFIPNRLHQAMINFLYLNKLVLSNNFIADQSIFDIVTFPSEYNNYYIGASLGGIYGSVFLSLCSDITRGILIVPGFPFELLLPRSSDFTTFWILIEQRFDIDVDRLWLLSFIQLYWTRMSPSGYLSHLNDADNLLTDDDTVTNVLINYNLGDSQVSWLGAYNMGRTLNCYMYNSQIPEQNETILGFNFINDDVIININTNDNSAACRISGWYFEHPIIPLVNIPPKYAHNTHGRRQISATPGIELFLFQNKIDNSCYGPCIDISNISDTNSIVNCTLSAGVPGLCEAFPYPLSEVIQNQCYGTDAEIPENSECGYKLFCNCQDKQIVIIFYDNDPENGDINCLNREKINANILYADNAESCQPIILGDNNKCVPDYVGLPAHVTFNENSLIDCCQC